MSSLIVSSGVTSTGLSLLSGDTLTVLSSGVSLGNHVGSGASLFVSLGGLSTSDTVASGGIEIVESGGVGRVITLSGGNASVDAGGVALATRVASGTLTISAGASATGTVLRGAGAQEYDYGVSISTTVSAGGAVSLFGPAAVARFTHVLADGQLLITGATAVSASLASAGSATVFSGGVISAATLVGGASLTVESQGLGKSITLQGQALEGVNVGGVQSGIVVGSGAALNVFGGFVVGPTGASVNDGYIEIQSGATMTLRGALDNDGLVVVDSTVQVGVSGTATLSGGGELQLSAGSVIQGTAVSLLDNEGNLIDGTGDFAGLKLTNRGTIDGDADGGIVLGTAKLINQGLLEATTSGAIGLYVLSAVSNAGGVIEAGDSGSVYVGPGAVISGGTLSSVRGGEIIADSATFDGQANALVNLAEVRVKEQDSLALLGTISNGGVILVEGVVGETALAIETTSVVLTGGGLVHLTGQGDAIVGSGLATTLINRDNTITGDGLIGGGDLVLINSGVVNANDGGAGLAFNTVSTVNLGLMEATSGELVFDTTVSNAGGTILAARGDVYLQQGAVISGGLLSATRTGLIIAHGSADAPTLDGSGVAVTNRATVLIDDGNALDLAGAIVNSGLFTLEGSTQTTGLLIAAGGATLSGPGTVEMSDYVDTKITGVTPSATLSNVGNTIEGAGDIGGAGHLILVNQGTIDATGTAYNLVIDATSVTNRGLIEATGAAGLVLEGAVQNAGGVIFAGHANIVIDTPSTIVGGALSTTDDAAIDVEATTNLSGGVGGVVNGGELYVVDGATLNLAGVIANTGRIVLGGTLDPTSLVIAASLVTLSGGGEVDLGAGAGDRLVGAAAGDALINIDNTIHGNGEIGALLTLSNGGVVDADSGGLVLDATSVVNTGLIEATGGSNLVVSSLIRNSGGVVGALGGYVFLASGGGVSGGLLTGQPAGPNIIEVASGGQLLSVTISGVEQTVISAGAIVRGEIISAGVSETVSSGATVSALTVKSGSVAMLSSGANVSGGAVFSGGALLGPGKLFGLVADHGVVASVNIGAGGVLSVFAGFEADNIGVASGGTMSLASGAATSAVTVFAGGVVQGPGTLLGSITDHGLVSGAAVGSGGRLVIAAGASGANDATLVSGTIVDGGVLAYAGAGPIILSGALSGAGKLVENGLGALVQSGVATAFSGQFVISGGTVELAVSSGAGAATIAFEASGGASATLTLDSAARPQVGATFANTLVDFDAAGESIDLVGVTFVSGASASVAGNVLTVKDGGYTAHFHLGGTSATAYAVANDGAHGVRVSVAGGAAMAHAMAAFVARPAGTASISPAVSAVSPWLTAPRTGG